MSCAFDKNTTNKMAEVAGVSTESVLEITSSKKEIMESCEPDAKKIKLNNDPSVGPSSNLESRLAGILCCTVCLDLPTVAVYQCSNGHLMCVGCMSHLLADARLKDESATCPNCRCEISKTVCSRNLAVEKAVSELPTECKFCSQQLPRNVLDHHERHLCTERITNCKYGRIGCPWRGPFHELLVHEASCCHPHKTGAEVMETLLALDVQEAQDRTQQDAIFRLLSFEKIAFSDLQLKPYRTDDFITKLFYETSRFTAFNQQWVVKARVNDHKKSPNLTCKRVLSYQIVSKNKLATPMNIHYIALKGPYGEMRVNPAVHQHEFTSDTTETEYNELPLVDYIECNKQLSAKTINLRLIMFQVQK